MDPRKIKPTDCRARASEGALHAHGEAEEDQALHRHEEATQAKTHRQQLQEGAQEDGEDVRNPILKQSPSQKNASN